MNKIRTAIGAVSTWLQGEPVAAGIAAAQLLTLIAHFGVHLSTDQTALLGIALHGVAVWSARRQVTPRAHRRLVRHVPERVVRSKRLGRHVHLDPRSRAYPAAMLVDGSKPVASRSWRFPGKPLDQRELGSCTGNATTHLLRVLAGRATGFTERVAVAVYEHATLLDATPGSYPPEDTGSDGLSALKAAQQLGYINADASYRWCFGLGDVLNVLSQHGPVIIGIPWYEGFDTPAADGTLTIAGKVRGGHEVCLHAVDAERRTITGVNSWGASWGPLRGHFRMTWETLDELLRQHGDAATIAMP